MRRVSVDTNHYWLSPSKPSISPRNARELGLRQGEHVIAYMPGDESDVWNGTVRFDQSLPEPHQWYVEMVTNDAPDFGDHEQEIGTIDQLSPRQAYEAMVLFLEKYWKRGPSDELAILLSSVSLEIWADGTPGDPASWNDWMECVNKVLEKDQG